MVERRVTMQEVMRALAEHRLREVFGSGTACQVCPVHSILYQGKVSGAGAQGEGGERSLGPHGAVFPSTSTFPPWSTDPSLSSASRRS